ncbi:hypothetical protein C5167_034672 [Papaver somniferum]|uniref:Uncharacterized protein n=1 Tax=Papaver somniferum TaxID=3469 RepID=A0A4Y7KG98_PAPSO|nr:hypothetical protein C5167_034672 [Papaver somniferum]
MKIRVYCLVQQQKFEDSKSKVEVAVGEKEMVVVKMMDMMEFTNPIRFPIVVKLFWHEVMVNTKVGEIMAVDVGGGSGMDT